ncbi:MAG: hypothetical protein WC483_00560 [Candidatus Paceibacterota bacterium]
MRCEEAIATATLGERGLSHKFVAPQMTSSAEEVPSRALRQRTTPATAPAMDIERGESRMIDPEEYDGEQAPPPSEEVETRAMSRTRPNPPPPPRQAPRKLSVVDIVNRAAVTLQTDSPRHLSLRDIRSILMSHVPDAASIVRSKGEGMDVRQMNRAFYEALLQVGSSFLAGHPDSGLGDILVDTLESGSMYPVTGGAGGIIVSGGGGGVVGGGVGLGGVGTGTSSLDQSLTGEAARTVVTAFSSDRDATSASPPNVIRVPLRSFTGLALPNTLFDVTRIELIAIKMNESSLFVERSGGAQFFISIDEVVKDFNRQTDPSGNHCQWSCSSRTTDHSSVVEIIILSKWIKITSPIDLSSTLTFRFFDDQKLPLRVEQDVYQYEGYAWDDINLAIVFTIPSHTMLTGDRISIRGIVCTEDLTLFTDDHRFRAEVVDLTHIRVYAYRPQGPPFFLPDDGRHVVSTGGNIVCMNNIIVLTFAVEHIA